MQSEEKETKIKQEKSTFDEYWDSLEGGRITENNKVVTYD